MVTSYSSSKASSMAELMAKSQATFYVPQKGKNVKGKVTKLTPSEILVDINAKTEAVVLEKEKRLLKNILQNISLGQEVEVTVLNPESEMGNPVVSLRKFLDSINWEKLAQIQKEKKALEAVVTELTRGGFVVETQSGVSGFLPNSQANLSEGEVVGKKIQVFVWELNKTQNKIIFSQKPVVSREEFEKVTKNIKVGETMIVTVSNVTPFGLFVSLSSSEVQSVVDGLIHISEISWEKVENIENLFSQGQKIQVQVIGKDMDAKRIDLSIKRLQKDPFEESAKSFKIDQKVSGKVTNISSFGVIIDLGEGVEGLIRKEKIPPGVVYSQGQEISATVAQIDNKRRKIVLVPVLLKKTIGYR